MRREGGREGWGGGMGSMAWKKDAGGGGGGMGRGWETALGGGGGGERWP